MELGARGRGSADKSAERSRGKGAARERYYGRAIHERYYGSGQRRSRITGADNGYYIRNTVFDSSIISLSSGTANLLESDSFQQLLRAS